MQIYKVNFFKWISYEQKSISIFLLFILLSLLCDRGFCLNYRYGPDADFNVDRAVNFQDYSELAGAWQANLGQSDFNSVCDLYSDDTIDLKDLDVFTQYWLWQQPATHRERINFNIGWKFYKGAISGDTASNYSYNDSSWYNVTVPHNPPISLTSPDPARPAWGSYSYEGVSWYRKHFTLDSYYQQQGRKIFIEFEAANTVADVWINGTYLTTHYGGYLPFTVDITDYANFGATENVIAVKVDNTYNPDVPPGESGWFNWPGIYRDVWLHITDKLHVTDAVYAGKVADGGIFVTYPAVSTSQAQVQIKTNVKNEYTVSKNCVVKTYLLDPDNQIVDTDGISSTQSITADTDYTFTQTTTVDDPCLWHPDHPYLYTVLTQVYDDDVLVDTYRTHIGIRSIDFTKDGGFKINGETLRFMGTNRMQDYPYIGYAISNSEQYREAVRLKEAGFQYVRTAHYPQDPAFMDACDELGIMVMDEIPGFQNIGGTTFINRSYQDMRDMIRRDRNHACVIAWELSLNETGFNSTYANNAYNIGHAEYPGDQCFVSGWRVTGTSYPDVYIATPNAGARTYSGNKPLVISEYGEYEYTPTSNADRATWWVGGYGTIGYGEPGMLQQAWNHQEGLHLNRGMSNMCGDGLWVAFDYANYEQGIIDKLRIPKFSYYFFQSQRDPSLIIPGIDSGPMIFIANYWASSSPDDVKVYSNCEQVKLYINNVLQSTRSPDTAYPAANLLHPPFTFSGLTWVSGELKAEGLIGGQVVATHIVKTYGTASSIIVSFGADEMTADGSDIIFVYATVVSANGAVVQTFGSNSSADNITFNVTGPATFVSPTVIRPEAGIAAALLRSTNRPGQITVTATRSGLTGDSATIDNIMPERGQD
ncbi:MAG: glycoside hydrolase family 2 TIM barrel-domain containing protein [Phycisphaerae bacterium]